MTNVCFIFLVVVSIKITTEKLIPSIRYARITISHLGVVLDNTPKWYLDNICRKLNTAIYAI